MVRKYKLFVGARWFEEGQCVDRVKNYHEEIKLVSVNSMKGADFNKQKITAL
jgi:hypothetical protein